MQTYLVGIDSVSRQYYRVRAADEEAAHDALVAFAYGDLEGPSAVTYHDSCDSDLMPDSVDVIEDISDDYPEIENGGEEKPAA